MSVVSGALGACGVVRAGGGRVEDDEMPIIAHAAHAWLEASLFAPAGLVVAAAIVRSALRSGGGRETKENP